MGTVALLAACAALGMLSVWLTCRLFRVQRERDDALAAFDHCVGREELPPDHQLRLH